MKHGSGTKWFMLIVTLTLVVIFFFLGAAQYESNGLDKWGGYLAGCAAVLGTLWAIYGAANALRQLELSRLAIDLSRKALEHQQRIDIAERQPVLKLFDASWKMLDEDLGEVSFSCRNEGEALQDLRIEAGRFDSDENFIASPDVKVRGGKHGYFGKGGELSDVVVQIHNPESNYLILVNLSYRDFFGLLQNQSFSIFRTSKDGDIDDPLPLYRRRIFNSPKHSQH